MKSRRVSIKQIDQNVKEAASRIENLESDVMDIAENTTKAIERINVLSERMEAFSERMDSVSSRLGVISESVDVYADGYQAGYDQVLSSIGNEVIKIRKILNSSDGDPLAKVESVSRYVDQLLRRFRLQEFSPVTGEKYDASSMEIVGTIATEDPELIGKTATCIGSGVTSQGKAILRPKVTLYVPKEA